MTDTTADNATGDEASLRTEDALHSRSGDEEVGGDPTPNPTGTRSAIATDTTAKADEEEEEGASDGGDSPPVDPLQEALAIAEDEIEKTVGWRITVEAEDIPSSWVPWMCTTGVNSLCVDSTWSFIQDEKKAELWEKRGIKRIIIAVNEHVSSYRREWEICEVLWKIKSETMTIVWFPFAKKWESPHSWLESGPKTWWNLHDHITLSLQLFRRGGKCFYKSDFLNGFGEPSYAAENAPPLSDVTSDRTSTASRWGTAGGVADDTTKRWFQFRHWVLMWYGQRRVGWNYQETTIPPPNVDGTNFTMDSVLSLPEMESSYGFTLPNGETVPSVPLPNLPDVSLPSATSRRSCPAASPSAALHSPPGTPQNENRTDDTSPTAENLKAREEMERVTNELREKNLLRRPKNPWACHGLVELEGLKVCAKGPKLILSNAKVTHFWERKEEESNVDFGNSKMEESGSPLGDVANTRDRPAIYVTRETEARLELECLDESQAKSWVESLLGSGAELGEANACCVIS